MTGQRTGGLRAGLRSARKKAGHDSSCAGVLARRKPVIAGPLQRIRRTRPGGRALVPNSGGQFPVQGLSSGDHVPSAKPVLPPVEVRDHTSGLAHEESAGSHIVRGEV